MTDRFPPLNSVSEALRSREQVPRRFYQVIDHPAPLAGSEFPSGFRDWAGFAQLGFHHIVCLSSERPNYDPAPLTFLAVCELDDLGVVPLPSEPRQEAARIHGIARQIVDALQGGEGVLVHCAAGRGRTGTVLGVALRMLGFEGPQVIEYLNELHVERSGKGWPEGPWQARVARDWPKLPR
ncbi:MAG: hypothetical protein JWO82_438 [Akkermansiaceae bacterium]|nr:hypothetical protein [Akkermansiaceae bacterium]